MFPAIQSTASPSGVAKPYWITTSKLVRAETQRHGEVKPKNKTFRMLKNAPREDGKK